MYNYLNLNVHFSKWTSSSGVEAQSTLGGGDNIFARKIIYTLWKINKMLEFYMILARKKTKFYNIVPKN